MTKAPEEFAAVRSGVYRAPPSVDRLRRAAAAAKLAWLRLDLESVNAKPRFLAACAQALDFPDTFGANWDALADCLQDLSWRHAAGYVLHLRDARGFARAVPEDYATALEILRDAATFWKERGKVFIVLVDGASDLPLFEL